MPTRAPGWCRTTEQLRHRRQLPRAWFSRLRRCSRALGSISIRRTSSSSMQAELSATTSQAALALVLANPANATSIVTATVTAAVTDVVGILTRLYAAGARNIVLLNSPNLGATPCGDCAEQSAGDRRCLTQMAGGFNANLATQVNNFRAISPGLNIFLIDAFALQSQVAAKSCGVRICQRHPAMLRPGHGDNAADPVFNGPGRSEHLLLLGS